MRKCQTKLANPTPCGFVWSEVMNIQPTELSRSISEGRRSKRLSITRAARLIGCSQSTLSRIESGEQRPTPALLQLIARSLDLDLGELYELSGYPLPNERDDTESLIGITVGDLPPQALRELKTFVAALRRRYPNGEPGLPDLSDDRPTGLPSAT